MYVLVGVLVVVLVGVLVGVLVRVLVGVLVEPTAVCDIIIYLGTGYSVQLSCYTS
mgnify:CR=1 FL=1